MKNMDVLLIFLAIRLASVYLVQTFYVPDEYWQTLEVGHSLAFNYGHLTWEWTKGIRSYIPPLLIALLYKALEVTGLDTVNFLVYTPRVLQAVLSAYSDLCFYKWSGTKKWAVFCLATSWFWFYTGSRTLINTLECALSTIALSKFPWPGKVTENNTVFIWIVAFLFFLRPTSAVVWIPLCVYHIVINKKIYLHIILQNYLPIGILALTTSVALDSLARGSFIVTSYNFIKFNLVEDVGAHYGVQPWHWYLSTGFPAILGIQFIPFVLACLVILKNRESHANELVILGTLVFVLTIYSFLPHKEFRFILPVLPLVLYLTSRFLSAWSRKASYFYIWLVAAVIFIGNAVPAGYLSVVHQRGTLDVMEPLRDYALKYPKQTHLLFLMPCHSTPLYSHLHVNVTTRILTCLPNLSKVDSYVDESDHFYKSPNSWLKQHYPPNGVLPSHIILFDSLQPQITAVLSRYNLTHKIFHTNLPLTSRSGQNVLIYQKLNV